MDLTQRLSNTLDELKAVMQERKERIAELQAEINAIERENDNLEQTITQMLEGF